MHFSAADINAQQFERVKRGYDTVAVDRFMEELALYVDELQRRVSEREQTEQAALLLLQNARTTADETILAALAAAEEERAATKRAADMMVSDANERARTIIARAEARLESIEETIHQWRQDAAELTARLTPLVRELSYLAVGEREPLDVFDHGESVALSEFGT